MSQRQYLKKVLQFFGITRQSKPVSTPLVPHFKLNSILSSNTDEEHEYMSKVLYSNVIGSLMYAIVHTRPDISHVVVVVVVSMYMHDLKKRHW